jgi:hypothetical protein
MFLIALDNEAYGISQNKIATCKTLGVKKIPVVPVPDRPYFFLPTQLFFKRD